MGNCLSLISRSGVAKTVPPSPARSDAPIPPSCPPVEPVVRRPTGARMSTRVPAPEYPSCWEALEEQERLSRIARREYVSDWMFESDPAELVSDVADLVWTESEGSAPEEAVPSEEEMLEFDPVNLDEDDVIEASSESEDGNEPEEDVPLVVESDSSRTISDDVIEGVLDEDVDQHMEPEVEYDPETDPEIEDVVPEYNPYTDLEDVSEEDVAEESEPFEDLSDESDPNEILYEEEYPEMDLDDQFVEHVAEDVPVPDLARLREFQLRTDADWEALYTECGFGRSDPTLMYEEDPSSPPWWRRRRTVAELEEIWRRDEELAFLQEQYEHDMALGRAQRELGIGGPLMDDPFFAEAHVEPESPRSPASDEPEPCEPGPSRVRGPSSEHDEEPKPKKPCMKSSTYRKLFRKHG